jgi:hypothetical protein
MNIEPLMPQRWLAIVIVIGLLVTGAFAALSLTSGGLPGTRDSPSASFKGQATTGQTAAD